MDYLFEDFVGVVDDARYEYYDEDDSKQDICKEFLDEVKYNLCKFVRELLKTSDGWYLIRSLYSTPSECGDEYDIADELFKLISFRFNF